MNLDIHAAIIMVVIIAILGALFSISSGLRQIRKSRKVAYFRIRRKQMAAGWRALFFALVLVVFAFLFGVFGEPVSYRIFPPSPSPTLSPTITLTSTISMTPTISLTPTITLTPRESYTPTITSTPYLPIAIEAQFLSSVTPNPSAVFSPLIFSLSVNDRQPVNPKMVFQNPLNRIYITYSYDSMTDGSQFTSIWYQNGQMLTYTTDSWAGGTGGSGQDELTLPPDQWLAGIYQLVFFVGREWKVVGEFRVTGEPPTATFSPTPTYTRTPTLTPSATRTRIPTWTTVPTTTRRPSPTPTK